MSDAFQIGPFLLKMSMLVVIVSLSLGFVAISAQLKNNREMKSAVIELLSNALVLAFLVWKFSYVLFYFSKAVENPSSILYFSGGENGAMLAVVAVVVYLTKTVRKKAIPVYFLALGMATGFLAATGVYQLITVMLEQSSMWYHVQQVAICAFFLWWLHQVKEGLIHLPTWLAPVMWFTISQVYVHFFVPNREAVFAGLSGDQLMYYAFALLLLFLSRRVKPMGEGPMKKHHNVWAIVVLLGLLGWGIFDAEFLNRQEPIASSGEQGNGQIGMEKGNTAPDFELQQIGGGTVKLSDLRGKKVILNLWATWCPPCRAEMPDMQRYYEENKEKDVVILGVNLTDTESSPEVVADFVKLYGITFPILLDPDKEVANVYKAISIPTSYIIDSNGVVQNKYIGPMSEEIMENMLSAIK